MEDEDLFALIKPYLLGSATAEQEEGMLALMEEIVEGDAPIIAIRLTQENKVLVNMERADPGIFHNFRNSLILRNFKGHIKRKFKHPNPPYLFMGTLVFEYTTPLNSAPIASKAF